MIIKVEVCGCASIKQSLRSKRLAESDTSDRLKPVANVHQNVHQKAIYQGYTPVFGAKKSPPTRSSLVVPTCFDSLYFAGGKEFGHPIKPSEPAAN